MSQSARHQALLSEYKGNLFEFLVGVSLSKKTNLEIQFLKNLSDEFKKMLQIQESFIREFYPDLLLDLPVLADELSDSLISKLKLDKVLDIVIVGKVALAAQNKSFAEADIILKTEEKLYPISIKLSKSHAYVNTKSAGLKSFLTKYFYSCDIEQIEQRQESFNNRIDVIINEFGNELCSFHDIEYDGTFSEWVMQGRTSLSGELGDEERVIYKKMLYKINCEIYNAISELQTSGSFKQSLLPLIGFGDQHVIQATAYYKNTKNRYIHYRSLVEDISKIDAEEEVSLGELKSTAANFDIYFSERILQIRIKAMNKFTSKSFKLNCSVKVN
jgi:hypothetical protein